jgi:hypothetical protein
MPSTFEIPRRREHHCAPCEFHKCVAALMGGPGNVWRDYNCMHPEAFDDTVREPLPPEKELIRQRLIGRLLEHGRSIGRTERQPDWCPLRKPHPDNRTKQIG